MKSRTKDVHLIAYVALGVLGGAAFVAFDLVAETRMRHGTLQGALGRAHEVIDHVLPIVAGALFGVCGHWWRLRARLGAAEDLASRAEALRLRLHKLERDQAVWVLAAAILHELNNPLHALGLLLDELGTDNHDRTARDELITRACAQSDRALGALRRLRSLRSLDEPRFEPIALDRVLATLAADAGALAAEYGLRVCVRLESPVRANADPNYIRTIVENLIQNSLQALRPRGTGEITIALEAAPGRAVVSVSDDGPPLDRNLAAAIFTPLQSTKQTGLGLGLPIARALARAMHGDLQLDAADCKTFRLEVPVRSTS
ncbi:MAG: HAMP domain-containing sensor histidine kinase [Polyangiales bacterium]